MGKRGSFSRKEVEYIEANRHKLTVQQMAVYLNRSANTVQKTLDNLAQLNEEEELVRALHKKHYWAELKRQLSKSELTFFEKTWISFVRQFMVHDIVATDEMDIKDLVILEIQANTNLRERHKIEESLAYMEQQVAEEREKHIDIRDNTRIMVLQEKINSLLTIKTTLHKNYNDIQKNKEMKQKALKATRDQRFKQSQDSNKSLLSLFKELDTPESREREGKWLAFNRMKWQKATLDLSEYHEYEDGTVDRPFLTPESVMMEDDDEDEKKKRKK